jgi:hypothetical protein
MPEAKTYSGQCHCGAVRYEATTDLSSLADCNCSRCRRLGWIMQSLPAEDFRLISGEDKLTAYHFNSMGIDHLFCSVCGIESFARGRDGEGRELVMINVNCLENAPPIERAAIAHWDGASF